MMLNENHMRESATDKPCRCYEPTIESLLREFVDEFNRDDTELCDDEIIERFAMRIRDVTTND